jgi:uncharacterized protein (DUF433 family)
LSRKRSTVSADLQMLENKLDEVLSRVQRLEEKIVSLAAQTSRWRYLVARPHPWRRQLAIKGRNMTVGQLASTIRANGLSAEQASEDLELPLEAIHEAMAYYAENRALIDLEAAEERRRLSERGYPLEPQHLPR